MKELVKRKNDNVSTIFKNIGLFSLLLAAYCVQAQPAAPSLHLNTEGSQVTLQWSAVANATNYHLFYAPYPYQGEHTIASLDLNTNTQFSINLWQDATYYVAIKAVDANNQSSEYSNIGFLQILQRGEDYRNFWKSTINEIENEQYISDDFLYFQLPDPDSCFEGELNPLPKQRQAETLNQIRQLHDLSAAIYDNNSDNEVQNASLLQRANNSLTHTPATTAKCYSQAAYNGSSSSNLNLGSGNMDPAIDMIGLIDDAFNISTVGAVGHRRHLLNPFLQSTSYGQVFGASAVKVFNFSDNATGSVETSPEFVAFPYLRYPYVFFSDKTSTKKTPWNITIIEDKDSIWGNQHGYFSNAKVTVKQKDTDQLMTVQNQHTDTQGTGVPNNLSWTIDNWQYDTWYTVQVENIDYQSGETGTIEYDVFIDYQNFFNLTYPLESADYQQGDSLIKGSLKDQKDKDTFTLALDGNKNFVGTSQFSNMGYFISIYDPDKNLIKASDNPFTLALPNKLYTIVVSNCHQFTCYNEPKNYKIQID